MKFCWCTITVSNLEESLRFYQEIVGLTVSRRFAAGSGIEISFLRDGETLGDKESQTQVELICNSNAMDKVAKNTVGISLGFEVKSVDEMIKFVEAKGIKVESGPHQPNPHVKFFYVKDPDGVSIQFVENM